MKIAVIGATGNAGSRIVDEALRRGHEVTGVARDATKLEPRERLAARSADVADTATIAPVLVGHDAVVSSILFIHVPLQTIVDAVRMASVKRYLVVGGAGSLEVSPGKLNLHQPGFPEFARAEATKGTEYLEWLHGIDDLDWTFLSPSAVFKAGERTSRFRLGGDTLLVGEDGKSWVSFEDFAVAMLDEIEEPRHVRRRFTVGY